MARDDRLDYDIETQRQIGDLLTRVRRLEVQEAAGGALSLIETITLSVAAASIDFQDIPATFVHLLVMASLRTDRAGVTADEAGIRFNNDSGNNYDSVDYRISHNNTIITVERLAQSAALFSRTTAATAPANSFSSVQAIIADYLDTAKHKSIGGYGGLARGTTTGTLDATGGGGIWKNAAAISRVTIVPIFGTNLVAGSMASLYGVRG